MASHHGISYRIASCKIAVSEHRRPAPTFVEDIKIDFQYAVAGVATQLKQGRTLADNQAGRIDISIAAEPHLKFLWHFQHRCDLVRKIYNARWLLRRAIAL